MISLPRPERHIVTADRRGHADSNEPAAVGHAGGPSDAPMDELAERLDLDPVELRLRNDTQTHPEYHLPFASRHLAECLREGAARFGWDQRAFRRILPPYARRSKSLEVLIPILYLNGVSAGDFEEALTALLGKDAGGLSATTVGRLKEAWSQ